MRRKEALVTGEVYHIFNKSIAGFKIFNGQADFIRMLNTLRYFQIEHTDYKFTYFMNLPDIQRMGFKKYFFSYANGKPKIVQIISYCIMPTHFHLILKQLKDNAISIFMQNALNSYSHYFNYYYHRKGPLWQSKFKNILVRTNEQLLHLSRYLHLNPVTAFLVDRPEEWKFSSYGEYVSNLHDEERLCQFKDILNLDLSSYRKFVEDRASYQRELAKIKGLILE